MKSRLKWLARSRSLEFVLNASGPPRLDGTAILRWQGHAIHYRPGTSDQEIIYSVLLKPAAKAEYWLPEYVEPRLILDIGANVGATSVYLAHRFPRARIFSFEPVEQNFALLQANVRPFPNVTPVNAGLGAENGEFEILASDSVGNFGGFSLHAAGSDGSRRQTVRIRAVADAFRDLGIDHADLVKIDTEGHEFEILHAFPPAVLSTVRWIYGELHGNRDFALLEYLSGQFDIGVRKDLRKRLFMFHAARREAGELAAVR